MKPIRKLYFQNASGQRQGLNGEQGVFASELSGFGFSLAPDFSDLSRGFFSQTDSEKEPQNTLAFTMTFTRSAYTTYERLIDWLAAAGTITIVYNPTGTQEYYRDVTVSYIQKSELTQTAWLECPSSFLCTTPWYMPVPSVVSLIADDINKIKRYTYRYTPDLMYGSGDNSSMAAVIQKGGHIPAALEFSYLGGIDNPVIRLVGKTSGKTHGVCSVKSSFGATETLMLSTRYENSYVKKIHADGREEDLIDAVDLSGNPFFRIPEDEPCEIFLDSESQITGRATLLIYYYFRSV
ncbi:MAG: hypothetical protein J6V25_07965 [Oscillospiraceae bacterium]|nr:hypothetical protein [Oscillospiraceae bacterium]